MANQMVGVASNSSPSLPPVSLISMKSLLIAATLFMAAGLSSVAQVQELWRAGLTNSYLLCPIPMSTCGLPMVDYLTTTAAIDREGSTLVGGIRSENNFHRSSFLAKIDAQGRKLWDYLPLMESWSGVECLATDTEGNVFVSTRATSQEPRPLILTKLDPQGNELWRVAEFGASAGFSGVPHSSVKVDSSGNVFLLGMTSTPDGLNGYIWSPVVNKFAPDGALLWRVRLPGENYYLPGDFGLSKSLALLPDGSAIVVGVQWTEDGFQGVVAKINVAGKLEWLRHGDRGNFDSGGFSNVLPGPFGTILAGGSDSAIVFNRKGRLIRGINPGYACEVLGVFANGSFLINQNPGLFMLAYGPSGRERWKLDTAMYERFGFIQRENQWIAIGRVYPYPDELRFISVDFKGSISWEARIPGYVPHPYADERPSSVLTAHDGTIRVVMNLYHRTANKGAGVAVSAFAIESPRLLRNNPFLAMRARSISF